MGCWEEEEGEDDVEEGGGGWWIYGRLDPWDGKKVKAVAPNKSCNGNNMTARCISRHEASLDEQTYKFVFNDRSLSFFVTNLRTQAMSNT